MRSASSSSIRSGGSSCSGCPATSADRYELDLLQLRPAAGRDLPALRHRLDRRRLAVVAADQGRQDGQLRAQDDDAGLRLRGDCRSASPSTIDNLWVAVLVIGVATAAHQAFSANLYTLPSDLFPRSAVGSVIGIGGTVGAVGGMLMSLYTGADARADRQLHADLRRRRQRLFPRAAGGPPAVAAPRAG